MEKLLPIGTAVEINNNKCIIVGYDDVEENDVYVHSYVVIPYPLGYVDEDSFRYVPVDAEMNELKKGYETEVFDIYEQTRRSLFDSTTGLTVSEWTKIKEETVELLEEGGFSNK